MYDYDEDDELLLNPICLINQYEMEKQNNNKEDLDVNAFKEQVSAEFNIKDTNKSNHKGRPSLNSTVNTNYAVQNSFNDNNINYNISFFSFGDKQKKEDRKELTQKSIELLSEFILKEEKLEEINRINENTNDFKLKLGNIKMNIKENLNKIENNLETYFPKPFMRKNFDDNKLYEKFVDEEKEEKINISEEIKKKIPINKIDINDLKEV